MFKSLLGALVLSLSLSAQASEEMQKPQEQVAPLSDKQQVVQAFEQSCRAEQLANCACISESLVPMLSSAKVSLVQSQLESGGLNNKNLIARNQVVFNKAQNKCSGS
ncbi:hypothetical protein DZA50_02715 [Kangiella sp. HD9-110m-PIT-SAG07]|nr:hypothetical protein DZA50_02715 [Kangiella sp. HD9-110m-PIT-SAG07]